MVGSSCTARLGFLAVQICRFIRWSVHAHTFMDNTKLLVSITDRAKGSVPGE